MSARAVGQDQLASRQAFDRRSQRCVRRERRMVDLMYEVEEIVGLHAMHGHQAAHRGAVALVVVFLQTERLLLRDLEVACNIVTDALVYLLPQVDVMRIKRVVEIEHPGLHMTESARRGTG